MTHKKTNHHHQMSVEQRKKHPIFIIILQTNKINKNIF